MARGDEGCGKDRFDKTRGRDENAEGVLEERFQGGVLFWAKVPLEGERRIGGRHTTIVDVKVEPVALEEFLESRIAEPA